jgi:hypothetical protein
MAEPQRINAFLIEYIIKMRIKLRLHWTELDLTFSSLSLKILSGAGESWHWGSRSQSAVGLAQEAQPRL